MSKIQWIDPETGEDVEIDVSGWQLVINTESGEVCRMDIVSLALIAKMMGVMDVRENGSFRHSLLRPDGSYPLYSAPPDWWIDVLIERRPIRQ